MGLEAICQCQVDDLTADAKVLLEARELILRAPFRRTVQFADVTDLEVAGDRLRFRANCTSFAIELGQDRATRWARKISDPPPSLAKKLGIGHASPAFVIGSIDDPVLLDALEGHRADPNIAKSSVAIVHDERSLLAALTVHESEAKMLPIWIVYGKGSSASIGEARVRAHMRERGYRDTKVSAVSAALTATRYSQS